MTSKSAVPMPSRRDRIFAVALVLAYTVSVGQGFVLPFLPDFLERIETADAADRADQVGLAMAAFFAVVYDAAVAIDAIVIWWIK